MPELDGIWIASHVKLSRDPSVRRLGRRLGVSWQHALGAFMAVCHYVLEFAPSGRISDLDIEDAARHAGHEADPDAFFAALEEFGFVERDGDGVVVVNWYRIGGRLQHERNKLQERQQNYHERKRQSGRVAGPVRESPPDRSPDVSRNGRRTGLQHSTATATATATAQHATAPLPASGRPVGEDAEEEGGGSLPAARADARAPAAASALHDERRVRQFAAVIAHELDCSLPEDRLDSLRKIDSNQTPLSTEFAREVITAWRRKYGAKRPSGTNGILQFIDNCAERLDADRTANASDTSTGREPDLYDELVARIRDEFGAYQPNEKERAKVASTDATMNDLFDAYAAVARGRLGDPWDRNHVTVAAVVDRYLNMWLLRRDEILDFEEAIATYCSDPETRS